MPIEFHCSACNKLLRTADETAGRPAQCPACGTVMNVPETAAAGPTPQENVSGGEDPFGGGVPMAPPDDSFNPYEAPADYTVSQQFSTVPPEQRVRVPAIFLIIGSSLGIVIHIVLLASQVFGLLMMAGQGPNAHEGGVYAGMAVQIGFSLLGITLRAVVLFGAIKMKRLESYGLAMTAAIIAVIPCFSGCCLIELPFGIWALVVLADPNVKRAFR